ncbi:MAG: hypothetical protein ABR511_12805 [Acidimicrobiales bacterium]
MSEQADPKFRDPNLVVGQSDTDTHRAPEGEGVRAPLAQHGADHPEFSVFDGAGNETVVAVTTNDDGKVVQSTGATSAEAMKAAGKQDERLGKGFGPVDDHR